MGRRFVRQDQNGCLAGTREVRRNAVNELGPDAVKVMEITLDLLHVEIGRRDSNSGAQTSRPELNM